MERAGGEIAPRRPGRGESFRPHHRLRRSAEFSRCYREGTRAHGRTCFVLVVPNQTDRARLGISASRRLGKASVRNSLRRRVREIFRRSRYREALAGYDIVVHLKPAAAHSSFHDMKTELERLLRRSRPSGRGTKPRRR